MDSEIQEMWEKDVSEKVITYKNTVLFEPYLSVADVIENFEVRDDDVWLCGIPKSGTTWSQEMIWIIANDLNFEGSKVDLDARFPFLEYSGLNGFGRVFKNSCIQLPPAYFENSLEYVTKLPSPRFIKTHLPFHLLPRQLRTNSTKAKVIYVWRNPKDVCISYYHFLKWIKEYTGNFTNFCKLFLNDAVLYFPYWNHVIDFWNQRQENDIFFLKYENMKADLRFEIRRAANFLGKNLSDNQITKLEKHLSFTSMKANPALNRDDFAKYRNCGNDMKFMRKGEAGQWKTELSSEVLDQFDTWIRENLKNNKSLLDELL